MACTTPESKLEHRFYLIEPSSPKRVKAMTKTQTIGRRATKIVMWGALIASSLLIGCFTAFVGWNKAFAPFSVLVEHTAWTIHLPIWFGRLVGWLEMSAAAALLLSVPFTRLARSGLFAALAITFVHSIAATVHAIYGEWHTLAQSAIVVALCVLLVTMHSWRSKILIVK